MDVSKLCRSCMEEVAPWEREDADENTMEMFSFCTNIEICKEDKLPKHFCYHCTVLIESSYTYIRTARRVNGKLKKLVLNGSNNFVDNFLSKTNPAQTEPVGKNEDIIPTNFVEPDKIPVDDQDFHNADLDHDIFDEDDDKCLSEFKSGNNENQIKSEPIDYVEELSNHTRASTSTPSENKKENTKSDKIKCNICKKNFSSKGWYSRHMKTAHSGSNKKTHAVLSQLQKKEKLNGIKKIKKKSMKKVLKTKIEDEVKAQIKQTNDDNNEKIQVDLQDEKTDTKCLVSCSDAAEQNDIEMSKNDVDTEINHNLEVKTKNSEKAIGQEDSEVSGEVIKCKLCFKEFSSKKLRYRHLHADHAKIEDGQKIYLCPYCPKTYTVYSRMYYHATSHPEVSKHPCECGKVYRIRKELEQHRLTHAKERPYACDKCGMKFKLKGILATHLKWHEGIRPYLCNVCGRSFMQSGNLESHMRVHTGERPFVCSMCVFRSTSRVSLKRHELRHRGERPYPCTMCPKRFYESCSLKRHLRSHTRERPYKCPYCSRDFFDSGKRRRHFINAHSMAPDEIPPMDKDGAPVERTATNGPRKKLDETIT